MEERVGVRLRVAPGGRAEAAAAVEVGLRANPRRAHLLVSRLLGKHVPVPVGDVLAAGHDLGALAAARCGPAPAVVVGFAETATGLGHAVAAVCAAPYLPTTRRRPPPGAQVVAFLEEHSHATEQALVVVDDGALRAAGPLVLVDDELSTGRTAANAIAALHARWPRRRYVVASLLDARPPAARADLARRVGGLGAHVDCVSLLDADVDLPDDVLDRARRVRDAQRRSATDTPAVAAEVAAARAGATAPVAVVRVALPVGPAHLGAGWGPADETAALAAARDVAARLGVAATGRTLVLGDEEFMYVPQLVAAALGAAVRTSTTSRSPALVVDAPRYPLRTALTFPATDDGSRAAYAYNVAPSALTAEPGNAPGFDDIVLVTDAPLTAPGTHPLVAALAAVAARVHVVLVADRPRPVAAC